MLGLKIIDSFGGQFAKAAQYEISFNESGEWRLVGEGVTDSRGTAKPIADREAYFPGYYELTLFLGEYFRAAGYPLPGRKFVDIVPIRFGIDSVAEATEITVTVGPNGYSVHRSTGDATA